MTTKTKMTRKQIAARKEAARRAAVMAEIEKPTMGTLRPSYGRHRGTGGRGNKARVMANMTSGRNATTGREYQPL